VTNNTLVDQGERDTIANALGRTLFVEAGAGTGKTRSLVDRVVRVLATGRATATSIAAITFGEPASAELRDRIRETLERLVADKETDPTEHERCETALADLDGAAVETIHAFCRRLLSTHPLQAGLPLAFDLLDGTEGESLFRDQWDVWFEELLTRAESDASIGVPLLRALALGATPDRLRDLASELRGHWDRLQPTMDPVPQPELDIATIADAFDVAFASIDRCNDPTDRMSLHLTMLQLRTERLRSASDEFAALQALLALARNPGGKPWSVSRVGAAPNWPKGALNEVRADVAAAHTAAAECFDAIAAGSAAALTFEIARFVLGAAAERRQTGRLEFQDLLVLTRDLLAGQPEVRIALRDRYAQIFIDEFQDTDPLQAEIAFLLGHAPDDVPAEDWLSLSVDAGRLFFVGDPKQSIYRFRRADIVLYRRVRERFDDALVQITQNFRSVPAVIEWVNAHFAVRFATDVTGRQAPYMALAAARPALADGAAVYRIGGARDASAGAIRNEEAATIVGLLQRIRDEEWPVHDGDSTRPARLQDIAILSRTRTGLRSIVDALEDAAIPHRIESRSLVFEAQEVRELVAILCAIDDPTDEVALIAALRSPGFACGDDDLVRYRAIGGQWDFRRDAPPDLEGNPVVEALGWLRAQHERRWWVPLTTLVDDVVRERGLFELAFVDRRPRERWQRLRFVAEQARAHAERPEATLRSLIDWLQWQAQEGAQVQERVVPEPDDDAVRLMTIHSSKGLQFPIVVLVGLNAPPRRQPANLLWNDVGSPEISLGPLLRTAGFETAQTMDALLDQLERDRLLYVAMTRAEDYLVLSLFHPQRKEGSRAQLTLAEEIAVFAEAHPELSAALEVDLTAPSAGPTPSGAAVVEQSAARETWQAERRVLIDAQRARHTISATTLARERVTANDLAPDAELDAGLQKDAPVEETPPWRRGRAGTAIGRAVHSVLQTVDLTTGADLAAIAAAQAAAEGVGDRAAEVQRLARLALDSTSVREAVAANRYWREVYVAADIDGVIVDGFIDLLYQSGDGYVVVDYKTDAIGARNADEVLARYVPQAMAYALVLGEQLDHPVRRCEFVFVNAPGGAAVRTVEVTKEAIAELRASVPSSVS